MSELFFQNIYYIKIFIKSTYAIECVLTIFFYSYFYKNRYIEAIKSKRIKKAIDSCRYTNSLISVSRHGVENSVWRRVAEWKRREVAMEGARSTDKCLRTANNEGAGSGVRDVLTFLYIDVFPRDRVHSRRAQGSKRRMQW